MISYLLTGLSIIIAGGMHWKNPHTFWRTSFISMAIIVVISLIGLYTFQSNNLGLAENTQDQSSMINAVLIATGLLSFFGLLVSVLVGYFLKAIRP